MFQTPRAKASKIELNNSGQLFIAGGVDKNSKLLKSIEVYDTQMQEWVLSDKYGLKKGRYGFQLGFVSKEGCNAAKQARIVDPNDHVRFPENAS